MNKQELITYISLIIILISLISIGMNITGYAVTSNETGVVNVTITSSGALNFSTALLNFGVGAVDAGEAGATIDSEGTVTGGSWAATNGELVLENIGNVNVSLTLSSNNSVEDFIGGSSPTFKAKVADKADNTGACTSGNFSSYSDINTTLQIACHRLGYDDAVDEIDIDFQLYIPNNAVGARSTGIVAIGTYY